MLTYNKYVENLIDRITMEPGKCGGKPCIRGMRIRVIDILDLMAAGMDKPQVLEELHDLEPLDIDAAVLFARKRVEHTVLTVPDQEIHDRLA